eukprot:g1412.t1
MKLNTWPSEALLFLRSVRALHGTARREGRRSGSRGLVPVKRNRPSKKQAKRARRSRERELARPLHARDGGRPLKPSDLAFITPELDARIDDAVDWLLSSSDADVVGVTDRHAWAKEARSDAVALDVDARLAELIALDNTLLQQLEHPQSAIANARPPSLARAIGNEIVSGSERVGEPELAVAAPLERLDDLGGEWAHLVRALGFRGQLDAALRVVDALESGVAPDPISQDAAAERTTTTAATGGTSKAALASSPDDRVYLAALAACAEAGNVHEALRTLGRLRHFVLTHAEARQNAARVDSSKSTGDASDDFRHIEAVSRDDMAAEADAETLLRGYTSAMHACARAVPRPRPDIARELLSLMENRDGLRASAHHCTAAMSAHVRAHDGPGAFALFEAARASQVVPTTEMLTMLVRACALGADGRGAEFEKATGIVEAMAASVVPDAETTKAPFGIPEPAPPTVATYNALLEVLAQQSHWQAASMAVEVLSQMATSNLMPDRGTASALLRCATASSDAPFALAVLDEMEHEWGLGAPGPTHIAAATRALGRAASQTARRAAQAYAQRRTQGAVEPFASSGVPPEGLVVSAEEEAVQDREFGRGPPGVGLLKVLRAATAQLVEDAELEASAGGWPVEMEPVLNFGRVGGGESGTDEDDGSAASAVCELLRGNDAGSAVDDLLPWVLQRLADTHKFETRLGFDLGVDLDGGDTGFDTFANALAAVENDAQMEAATELGSIASDTLDDETSTDRLTENPKSILVRALARRTELKDLPTLDRHLLLLPPRALARYLHKYVLPYITALSRAEAEAGDPELRRWDVRLEDDRRREQRMRERRNRRGGARDEAATMRNWTTGRSGIDAGLGERGPTMRPGDYLVDDVDAKAGFEHKDSSNGRQVMPTTVLGAETANSTLQAIPVQDSRNGGQHMEPTVFSAVSDSDDILNTHISDTGVDDNGNISAIIEHDERWQSALDEFARRLNAAEANAPEYDSYENNNAHGKAGLTDDMIDEILDPLLEDTDSFQDTALLDDSGILGDGVLYRMVDEADAELQKILAGDDDGIISPEAFERMKSQMQMDEDSDVDIDDVLDAVDFFHTSTDGPGFGGGVREQNDRVSGTVTPLDDSGASLERVADDTSSAMIMDRQQAIEIIEEAEGPFLVGSTPDDFVYHESDSSRTLLAPKSWRMDDNAQRIWDRAEREAAARRWQRLDRLQALCNQHTPLLRSFARRVAEHNEDFVRAGQPPLPSGELGGSRVTHGERQSWIVQRARTLLERHTEWAPPAASVPAVTDETTKSSRKMLAQCHLEPVHDNDTALTRGALLSVYARAQRLRTTLDIARSAFAPLDRIPQTPDSHLGDTGSAKFVAGPRELRSIVQMLIRARRYDAAAALRGGILVADNDTALNPMGTNPVVERKASTGLRYSKLPPPATPQQGALAMLPFKRDADAVFVYEFDGAVHSSLIAAETRRGEFDRALSLLLEVGH